MSLSENLRSRITCIVVYVCSPSKNPAYVLTSTLQQFKETFAVNLKYLWRALNFNGGFIELISPWLYSSFSIFQAVPHSRREIIESLDDETFGSTEVTSLDRAEEERKRRGNTAFTFLLVLLVFYWMTQLIDLVLNFFLLSCLWVDAEGAT